MSKKDKEYVVITSPQRSICTLKNEGAVYSITGKQLKKCLAGYDSSVVYLWAPRCSSPNCVLIPAFHDACLRKGYTSFVVAEYYDIRIMKAQNITESPIFAFNTEYYGTERVGKLIKLFFRDLLLHPYSYKEYGYGRYLVFHSDSLVRVADNIENDL